ncbi:leucine-rich repeat neuronal protein 4-like [Neolamprologus brichardi]|uniref:Leucine-rich repeat neuronal protein 4-like n=1 Tax=Neolamprologus brichardi TaxID=32507 RepID=A0A3Q4G6H4_NEOBR|nr:leucine-rich repeat neuronal protein 4-like [Neolamprologus brichardi]
MTSFCRNLVALVFLVLPPMHSHFFTNAASASPPITHPQIIHMTDMGSDRQDDYDLEEEYDTTKAPPRVVNVTKMHQKPQLCEYDPCSENQVPCAALSEQTGCLCPGMSGANVPPHPPRIQALVPVSEGSDRGKIQVQWCAPSSVVSEYRIFIEGRDGEVPKFGDASRRGLVRSLEVGTKVCVVAVNNAGSSDPSEFSCKRYECRQSPVLTVMAWIIGGLFALLLLVVIGTLICGTYQEFRKGKRDSIDGLTEVHVEHCDLDKCSSVVV